MNNYGIWTVITPLITIILAIMTRQVILSLLMGILVGYTIINDHNILSGIKATLIGIIATFASTENTQTIIFILLIGGIMRLISVTGGVRSLVYFFINKTSLIKNKKAIQLLAMFISIIIFIESSINQLVAGASTKNIACYYGVSPEKMAYIIQTSGVSVCSSVMINGWGAAMMGVIGVQVSKGFISGEPFKILATAMPYNIMAWLSLASVLFYIFTDYSWGPMKIAEQKTISNQHKSYQLYAISDEQVTDHPGTHTVLNFFIPILATGLMVPIALFITGDGEFSKGSGSTSVYWAVMFGTLVSFIWFLARRILTIEIFFKEIYIGYASMIKISSVMILAFLMGNVSADLNTGAYIAQISSSALPAEFSIAFIFLISAIMSLATGTSWGTFAIMIPIGVQLGISVNMSIELMIGAAITGSIFGDMTSPISSDAIVASMATDCDHIEHIRTQMPYAIVTGIIVLIIYLYLGFNQ
ncbi:MAG: Na+/H+ antiporter NhaC family protein [Arsenophonus sp. NC-WZS1-MAG3]